MITYPAQSDPLSVGEVNRGEEKASGFKGQIKSRLKWSRGRMLREVMLKVIAEADRLRLMVLSGSCPCSHAARGEPRGDQDAFRGLRLNGSVRLLIFNAGAI